MENKIGGQELLEVREKYVKEKGKPLPRAINYNSCYNIARNKNDIKVKEKYERKLKRNEKKTMFCLPGNAIIKVN